MFSLKIDRFDRVIIFVTFLNKFFTRLAIALLTPVLQAATKMLQLDKMRFDGYF